MQQPTAFVQLSLSPISLYMSQLNGIDAGHLPWSFSPQRTDESAPFYSLGVMTLPNLAQLANSTSSWLLESQTIATWFIHDLPYYLGTVCMSRESLFDGFGCMARYHPMRWRLSHASQMISKSQKQARVC
jgi:hypothetical protein